MKVLIKIIVSIEMLDSCFRLAYYLYGTITIITLKIIILTVLAISFLLLALSFHYHKKGTQSKHQKKHFKFLTITRFLKTLSKSCYQNSYFIIPNSVVWFGSILKLRFRDSRDEPTLILRTLRRCYCIL